MAPQYATWMHSSHRERATCNDCHVPHDNVFNTYYFKAKDGLRHATVFTMRGEPQVIKIKEEGHHVVHQNCIRCHTDCYRCKNEYHAQFYSERTNVRVGSVMAVPHGKVKV